MLHLWRAVHVCGESDICGERCMYVVKVTSVWRAVRGVKVTSVASGYGVKVW
jgi:hypothetical protein